MANLVFPSPKMAPGEGTDKYVQDLVQNIVHARPIFYFLLFQFLTDSVMDINELYQYITTFNLINITIKNTAINTGRLWRRPVLCHSEIVCMVAILDVQGDTAISL